ASGSLRWEYKVVSLGEELIDLFFESVFSFALFAMEMESMVDEIDPYASPNALLEYVLPEVIELIIDSMDYAAGSFESKLNEYGAQGWELVSVQDGMAYFKRQVP